MTTAQKTTPKQFKLPLVIMEISKWYKSLPKEEQKRKREQIMLQLQITKKTFYNYLNGTTCPSHPYSRLLVNEIAGVDITYKYSPKTASLA